MHPAWQVKMLISLFLSWLRWNQFTPFVGEQSMKTFAPSLLEKYVLFQQNNVQILQFWCQGKQVECIQSEPLMVSSVYWVHIQSEPLMGFSVDWVYIRSEPFDGFLSSPGIAYIKSLLSLALEIHFYTDSCVSWPVVFNLAIDQAGAHTMSIKNKDGNSDKFSNCSDFDGFCLVESIYKSPKKNSTGMMVDILEFWILNLLSSVCCGWWQFFLFDIFIWDLVNGKFTVSNFCYGLWVWSRWPSTIWRGMN